MLEPTRSGRGFWREISAATSQGHTTRGCGALKIEHLFPAIASLHTVAARPFRGYVTKWLLSARITCFVGQSSFFPPSPLCSNSACLFALYVIIIKSGGRNFHRLRWSCDCGVVLASGLLPGPHAPHTPLTPVFIIFSVYRPGSCLMRQWQWLRGL